MRLNKRRSTLKYDFRLLAKVDPEKDGVDPARVRALIWKSDRSAVIGTCLGLDWSINLRPMNGCERKYWTIDLLVKQIKEFYDDAKHGA